MRTLYRNQDKYELWTENYFIYLNSSDVKFDLDDFKIINEVADNYLRHTPEQRLLMKHDDET
ncbi:hypothetical protein QNI16_34140 [Cytophagaceae bacterium YF14B1]|uniref:Uncharacterized protein n=1 Tax=Xanthocytophaga flava TaxID=3048013 RepID=A0AAE3UAI2_9BACT|nr:hypothetical protein [Xanthocytophaga flavus]MDJ1485581.1 hypothetical protein [Xanthocytophaga flavus]